MKIATWNVNSLRVRLPQFVEWLDGNPVDVIGLQETEAARRGVSRRRSSRPWGCTPPGSARRPTTAWRSSSRQPLTDVALGIPGFDDPQRRVIAATVAGVRVINVYVPNGQSVGSDKYAYKLDWLARLAAYVDDGLAPTIRWSRWSATTTSRRRIATCTTRPSGKVPCTSASRNARRSASCSAPA